MSAETLTRRSDGDLFNASSQDFVPVACHFDQYTLLTKNGELLQTIEINGINSEKISKNLFNLRNMVRKAIKESVDSNKFAFWIHTIRRKANLDDDAPYYSFLSANLHDTWRSKNYWDDKFVNRLYITIIYDAPEMKIRSLGSLIASLSPRLISSTQIKYFEQATEKLTTTADKILALLQEYGAEKLGMRFDGQHYYSDMMFLYRRIMQLNEDECLVPITDISKALASHKYAVGSDKLEVTGNTGKKFAAIMSIKEYQEVSSEALDRFLQIPVEMICTEIFYFVDRSKVVPLFEYQDYILGISGDNELKKIKGVDKILDSGVASSKNNFCHQQISFMVIGDNLKRLDDQVKHASEQLSKIGIVHVREDINLEKTFWAQLPGNFSFLSRMSPTILDNTAALASLHNFPTGNQYNPWGKAITLLRTEKGTPYFMNFHNQEGSANACIFGTKKSGRTTLLNFFLSEADKYNPTILYITDDMDSGIFVKAKGGRWFQREKGIINPLICDDSEEARKFINEFFKIIANHYVKPLSSGEINLIEALSEKVFTLPKGSRLLTALISTIPESEESGVKLKERLKIYGEGGLYQGVFEREEPFTIGEGGLVAFNLQFYDDQAYINQNYPKEKKLVEQFEYDLNSRRSIKLGVVWALHYLLKNSGTGPKIMAIDNLQELINLEFFPEFVDVIADALQTNNGVFASTVSLETLHKMYETKIQQDWIGNIGTSFILPPEIKMSNIETILSLETAELKKLTELSGAARAFIIKQDGKAIASELSIGGLQGFVKILCSTKAERDMYLEVVKEYGENKPEDWVEHFYNAISNN